MIPQAFVLQIFQMKSEEIQFNCEHDKAIVDNHVHVFMI